MCRVGGRHYRPGACFKLKGVKKEKSTFTWAVACGGSSVSFYHISPPNRLTASIKLKMSIIFTSVSVINRVRWARQWRRGGLWGLGFLSLININQKSNVSTSIYIYVVSDVSEVLVFFPTKPKDNEVTLTCNHLMNKSLKHLFGTRARKRNC